MKWRRKPLLAGLLLCLACRQPASSDTGNTDGEAQQPYHVMLVAVGSADEEYLRHCREELLVRFPGIRVTLADSSLHADVVPDYAPGKKSAEGILRLLEYYKPPGVNTCLGVTPYNIAVKERVLSDGRKFQNWSVLGLGSLVNGVCICSYHRMAEPQYFKKLVIHEFCHTLGIPHCPVPGCTMNDGDGSAAPIRNSTGLCRTCREQAFRSLRLNADELAIQ